MSDHEDSAARVWVDLELSAAIVAFCSDDRSPFPNVDPDAVATIARTRRPDELLATICTLGVEMIRIPVDWSTMTYSEGCTVASTEMAARHPRTVTRGQGDARLALQLLNALTRILSPQTSPHNDNRRS